MAAFGRSSVDTLFRSSLHRVMEFLPNYLPSLEIMPSNIKDKVLRLMGTRGLMTPEDVNWVLHDKVRVLSLTNSLITDALLYPIAQRCPQLRKIDLNATNKSDRTQITSQGIVEIARGCPLLQIVYLRKCSELTDEAIIALSTHCRHLRELNVGGIPNLTDASLQSLREHSSFLSSLNVAKANITDNGVINLVTGQCSQTLQELHIAGCQRVTDESVEAVLQFCPNMQVFIFHNCPLITDQSRIAMEELMGANCKMKQITWTIPFDA